MIDGKPFLPHGKPVHAFNRKADNSSHKSEVLHTGHALSYLADGWREMELAHPVRVQAGSLLIVPSGVPHREIASKGIDLWSVGFCASCLELPEEHRLMLPYRQVRRGSMPVIPVSASRQSRVLGLFADIQAETARSAPESPLMVRSLLFLLLGEVLRAMPISTQPASVPSLVSQALDYIQCHALEAISLKDVASAVYRSPAHVATVVKQETGHTVGDWITSNRVAAAASWLLHSDKNLDEIAYQVGWQDKTHFIRQFRKTYGQTPASWRRSQRSSI